MIRDNQLQNHNQLQKPPLIPPSQGSGSVTDQERHRRVTEEGSRRKRDLAGYRRLEAQLAAKRVATGEVAGVSEVWADASTLLATTVPESTFKIWLEPVEVVSGDGTTLFLTASNGIRTWVERRYLTLIREALQATGSGYTDVEFVSVGEGGR